MSFDLIINLSCMRTVRSTTAKDRHRRRESITSKRTFSRHRAAPVAPHPVPAAQTANNSARPRGLWPNSALFPECLRTRPKSLQPPVADADRTKNLTVCGSKCSGQSDCKASLDGYGCDCAFPNTEDARTLGLDPVSPPSICLDLDKVNFGLLSSSLSLVLLNGRDEKSHRYVDERGKLYQCRRNTTYIGNECCGSSDGMVWLE